MQYADSSFNNNICTCCVFITQGHAKSQYKLHNFTITIHHKWSQSSLIVAFCGVIITESSVNKRGQWGDQNNKQGSSHFAQGSQPLPFLSPPPSLLPLPPSPASLHTTSLHSLFSIFNTAVLSTFLIPPFLSFLLPLPLSDPSVVYTCAHQFAAMRMMNAMERWLIAEGYTVKIVVLFWHMGRVSHTCHLSYNVPI